MEKIRLYNVLDEYVNYLIQFDKKVLSCKEDDRKHGRKYLGAVLQIEDFKYFIPLSSPKDSDYIKVDGILTIRKSVPPLMRIVVKDKVGSNELKGTLKFSSMIPIPDIALLNYDVTKEVDETYKILVLKEISFINSNSEAIIKNARVIYNQKMNNYNIGYVKSIVDFELLEKKCKEYEIIKQALTESSKQIATTEDSTKNAVT
ncbi:MAG: hypothetical protein APF81_27250 [Desulfosporosinus sp. BRH_c37]|nr:MAG: hypothetical protein APF81_27250 [Desulfosporosinus sp. BRH_c37]